MKMSVALLAGSIVLNGAGVSALLWRPAYGPPPIRDFIRRHFASDAAPAPAAKAAPVSRAVPRKLWPAFDSGGDLPTLVARLRAAGFPPDVVRSIVIAELSARYDARLRAFFEPDPNTPFWKTKTTFFGMGDPRMEQYSQLQRERARLQRELLSDPFFASDDVTAAQRRQFGNLPRHKIDLLQRIEDDYAEMNAAIRSATHGITLAEDREKLALLSRERRADLAGVLSPSELADYEMRSSPISGMLGRQLGGFDASEAEFRAIFQAQSAFSERAAVNAFGMGGGNFEDQRAAAQEMHEKLKGSLGPARYAEYVRETDSTYQQLQRLVQRETLPPDAAIRAFTIRDKVADESTRIADDAALSVDQKRAALQALADRTRTELLGILGTNAGSTYIKIIEPSWLNAVQRGNAMSFNTPSAGASMMMSGSSGMPVAVSFGLRPSFRNVGMPPRPQP